jgi:hypothetical protein
VALALVAALLLAACGGDDDATGDGSGDNAGKAAGGTTSTTTSTSTTVASTTSTTAGDLAEGPEYVTTEGPSGAGCTPGERSTLPDGWWAGEVTAVDGSAMDLDLVCFFAGDAAIAAATEDGAEVTNDYYVRNNNARTFSVEFPPGVAATCASVSADPFPCTAADVLTLYRTTSPGGTGTIDGTDVATFPLVWVHITATTPDHLFMQYTP